MIGYFWNDAKSQILPYHYSKIRGPLFMHLVKPPINTILWIPCFFFFRGPSLSLSFFFSFALSSLIFSRAFVFALEIPNPNATFSRKFARKCSIRGWNSNSKPWCSKLFFSSSRSTTPASWLLLRCESFLVSGSIFFPGICFWVIDVLAIRCLDLARLICGVGCLFLWIC